MIKTIVNPDEEFVIEFKKKLKENGGYCPCRLEKIKDNKCKCKEFRDQTANGYTGYCHCGLYCNVEAEE